MLTPQTLDVLLDMVQEEYNDVKGSILMIDHQLTLPENLRKVPIDELGEDNLKNLKIRAMLLDTALEELNLIKNGQ